MPPKVFNFWGHINTLYLVLFNAVNLKNTRFTNSQKYYNKQKSLENAKLSRLFGRSGDTRLEPHLKK